jgi:methyl-accepting chemotaxis protein
MKLQTRLMATFLACGLTPLAIAAFSSYWLASNGISNVAGKADLESRVKQSLVAQQSLKREQLEGYFETIRDQAITFSNSPAVVNAMRDFRQAFSDYRVAAEISDEDLPKLKQELAKYYNGDFANEYRNQNDGKQPNVAKMLELDDESIALQHAYIYANANPLGSKHQLDKGEKNTTYNRLHAGFHPSTREFLEKFGYYDIFLVDIETGDIVYSVFKELDFSTSLLDGPYSDTNFARAFREAAQLSAPDSFVFVDYEQYTPSYEAPASFIASPIFDGDKKIGVAMFQMPLDRITAIMAHREGLGETGETILVGSDGLMRSDSFHDPENRSVVSSFRNGETGKVKNDTITASVERGESGTTVLTDYRGVEALVAYGPVNILGTTWAMNAKMDTEEAFRELRDVKAASASAANQIILWNSIIATFAGLAVAGVAWLISRRISLPIISASAFARRIARGDLTKKCEATGQAEVGDLITAMNDMRDGLREVIGSLASNSSTLAEASAGLQKTSTELSSGANESKAQSATVSSAAEEMSINMKNMASSTEQMSGSMNMVATSVDEMTNTIGEIAKNAERSATVAAEAADLAEVSNTKISDLGNAADEIGKVIEVIQDIAEQTNLLALNATIEAARAGEAGKGFAVVATEVKELAKQTAAATDDIRKRIEGIQQSTGDAVQSITSISEVIRSVNEVARTIASAVEEQSIATKQISQHVSETAASADNVSRGVRESASASEEITRNIVGVDQVLSRTVDGAKQSEHSGEELLKLAGVLRQIVGKFHINEENTPTVVEVTNSASTQPEQLEELSTAV